MLQRLRSLLPGVLVDDLCKRWFDPLDLVLFNKGDFELMCSEKWMNLCLQMIDANHSEQLDQCLTRVNFDTMYIMALVKRAICRGSFVMFDILMKHFRTEICRNAEEIYRTAIRYNRPDMLRFCYVSQLPLSPFLKIELMKTTPFLDCVAEMSKW
jgi:hypothetical protein